jgi:hypothetical protein
MQPGTGTREIAFDCRFFVGDQPCTWHKALGVLCLYDHYLRVETCTLIVKLDTMGDVLRTTAFLPTLAEEHPGAPITWILRQESGSILDRNSH